MTNIEIKEEFNDSKQDNPIAFKAEIDPVVRLDSLLGKEELPDDGIKTEDIIDDDCLAFNTDIVLGIEESVSHIRSKEKSFKCTLCDYRGDCLRFLNVHLLMKHSRKRLLRCDKCDFKSKHEYRLRHHSITHSNKKPFKCTYAIIVAVL
ncbi:hypothetical protein FQR65_LT00237 [Abscondita terminalis]|nr:hypothetical protein FQR65_LT00237 [Abscondita terminalis]